MTSSSQESDDEDKSHSRKESTPPQKPSNDSEHEEMEEKTPILSHRFRKSQSHNSSDQQKEQRSREESIAVLVSGPARPWEYHPFNGDNIVDNVLEKVKDRGGKIWYKVEYESGKIENISLETLQRLKNGKRSLAAFHESRSSSESILQSQDDSEAVIMDGGNKRVRTRRVAPDFVSTISADLGSESSQDESSSKRRRLQTKKGTRSGNRSNATKTASSRNSRAAIDLMDSDDALSTEPQSRPPRRSARAVNSGRSRPTSDHSQSGEEDDHSDSDDPIITSDLTTNTRAQRSQRNLATRSKSNPNKPSNEKKANFTRRSNRDRGAARNFVEIEEDDVEYAEDNPAKATTVKGTVTKETFKPLSKNSSFRNAHSLTCDVCDDAPGRGVLVHCQGCSTSIHQVCLGGRSVRLHRVTKVGEDDFVLQCRRCIGNAVKYDPTAPSMDACKDCKQKGAACSPFSKKRTTKEEERLRNENGGQDPVTQVATELLNNADNVLFRCRKCHRAFHFEHLPPKNDESENPEEIEDLRDERLYEYRPEFNCRDCLDTSDLKVESLVAWRPLKGVPYDDEDTIDKFNQDQIEYLVKWEDKSYLKCSWMDGSWTYGVTLSVMRKAFVNQEDANNEYPVFTAEEAIPEEYHRMEIILDVQFEDGFKPTSLEHGMENLESIEEVLVKFQGLNYVDVVWEEPPDPANTSRWAAFEAAALEFFRGQFFVHEPAKIMEKRVKEFRADEFEALQEQPEGFGDIDKNFILKPYQLDGMNFLRFNFHQQKNVILADDMGLGKTIQVIAFISALVKQDPECWPFLIVTPNSTCPNWRREIKTWAPDLRVVAYYGGKAARELAKEYELYPVKGRGLAAHVVITSYEAPVDKDGGSRFFSSVKWAGLIVDEGQRLKNDKSLLYKALTGLKTPFQCLLTGTPLQNNKRELWNLLAFLDKSKDAEALDAKYSELTEENLPEIHAQIRPHMLRRKKAEVLDLPPIAQVILPTSMSVLQKQLCRSIIEKNPVLIQSILAKDDGKIHVKDRGNLNNIMMQLRKVLAHPFMYSARIEEAVNSPDDELRILIEASSKMQLLKVMLPKLKERGHRVLLFSQFLEQLDLLEEFLHGIGLYYTRIDGKLGALEKQKRIDSFNVADSELFACLLSTRAGGVGINLATADTVIIMDPDFNPHQDMQALSRAHRIGQKNKVLVFQLMTRGTVEEKIMQIGRQKMALDQALIESIKSKDEPNDVDLATILKHGAAKLFDDDNTDDAIVYDSPSVDKLLDRSHLETTKTDDSKTSESQFSFARVWENQKGELTADIEDDPDAQATLPESVWVSILAKRLEESNAADGENGKILGRGRRAKQNVVYDDPNFGVDDADTPKKDRRRKKNIADDDEFRSARESDGELESLSEGDFDDPNNLMTDGAAPGQRVQKHERKLEHGAGPNTTSQGVTPAAIDPRILNGFGRLNPPTLPSNSNLLPLPNPFNGPQALTDLDIIRNPLQRPMNPVLSNGHPPTLPSISGPYEEIPCPSCNLMHAAHTARCPPSMRTSEIRILLDHLQKANMKSVPLYHQLRRILTVRASGG